MNVESWLGLASLAVVIGGAIVALAMKIAVLQTYSKNHGQRLDDEIDNRKEADKELEAALKQESDERKKKDSDVLGEMHEQAKRIQRWERRQSEMGYRPRPHDTPDSGDA